MTSPPVPRIVFDTNVVLSALLFPRGRLAWLRLHWREGCVPLISKATSMELARVLAYPKFQLASSRCMELFSLYVSCCESIHLDHRCPMLCRDPKDQPLLDLAHCGKADLLVTGDEDLLALAGQTAFAIETPEDYRRRFHGEEQRPQSG